jgi:hypothetical protein
MPEQIALTQPASGVPGMTPLETVLAKGVLLLSEESG